ncbi:endonuclease [Clostridia bacterium]|nr:endonuclease [Clostridia bacterium]
MDDKVSQIYETLLARYGDLHWWPSRTLSAGLRSYEIIVGAVLTQNTMWSNVEKAIANFGDNLNPQYVVDTDVADLIEIIRPAGFFNQKAVYLKAVTAWYSKYHYDVPTVQKEPLAKVRAELLATTGVGQETADSILLYGFGFPTFVIDAYTKRLCERYSLEVGNNYYEIKACFESNLPQSVDVYNNFHALIVVNAKEHCRKKPLCNGCPLETMCKKFIDIGKTK